MLPLLFSQSASSWTYWMCIGSHFFSSILICFVWTWNGATYPLPSAWTQGRKRGSKVKPALCRGPFPPRALGLPWTGTSSVPRRPDLLVKNTDSRAELPVFKSHARPRLPMWCLLIWDLFFSPKNENRDLGIFKKPLQLSGNLGIH